MSLPGFRSALKRAPSHFQEQMATVELAGLIISVYEIHIDDLNLFAQTDDEFVDRLSISRFLLPRN